MTFDLFWCDFYFAERLFGFGFFCIKHPEHEVNRNLFSIYFNDGEFLIDLFWVRVYSGFPDWYYRIFYKDDGK